MKAPRSTRNPSSRIGWRVAAGITAAIAIAIGALAIEQSMETRESVGRVRDHLSSVVDFKTEQVIAWRTRRLAEAKTLAGRAVLGHHVASLLTHADSATRRMESEEWMQDVRDHLGYESVSLVDDQGHTLFSQPASTPLDRQVLDLLEEARNGDRAVLSGIHHMQDGTLHIGVVAPIHTESTILPPTFLLLRMDPTRDLFPELMRWPTPSASAECLLIEQSGDLLLFPAGARFLPGATNTHTRSLNDPTLPDFIRTSQERGFAKAVDYRGQSVFAAVRRVPGSDWILIAKMDRAEIEGPILRRGRLVAAAVAAALILSIALVWTWWRQRHAETSREKDALIAHFQSFSRHANDILLLVRDDGRIIEANERAVTAYGYSHEELLQLRVSDLRPPEDAALVPEQMARCIREGGIRFEAEHIRKDGSRIPVELSSRANAVDGHYFFQSIVHDLTDLHRAHQALHQSEDLLRLSIEGSNGGAWWIEMDPEQGLAGPTTLTLSPKLKSFLGFGPAEGPTTIEEWKSRIHPDDRPLVDRNAEAYVLGQHDPYAATYRIRHRDQSWRWIRSQGRILRDARGRPLRWGGIDWDITEDRKREERLERISRLYATLSGSNRAMVRARTLHEVHQAVVRTLVDTGGLPAAWIVSTPRAEGFHIQAATGRASELLASGLVPETAECSVERLARRAMRSDAPIIGHSFSESGWEAWQSAGERFGVSSLLIMPLHGTAASWALFVATEECNFKDAEEVELLHEIAGDAAYACAAIEQTDRLRESMARRELLENVVRRSPAFAFVWSPRDGWPIEYASENVALLGYDAAALSRDEAPFAAWVHPDDLGRIAGEVHIHLEAGRDTYSQEYRIRTANGDWRWMDDRSTVQRNAHGDVEFIQGILLDITERKAVEQALHESERFARATIDSLDAHIAVLDGEGHILAVNKAWWRFAHDNGIARGTDFLGSDYLAACANSTPADAVTANIFAQAIRDVGAGVRESFAMEYPCHSPTERRWFCGRVTRFAGPGPTRIVVAHENITARHLADEHARRLATVVEQAHDAILITDRAARILYVNPSFVRVSGYRADEAIGNTPALLKSGRQDLAFYADMWATILAGKTWAGRLVNRRKDGTLYHEDTTISPIRDENGVIFQFVGIKRDVTREVELAQRANQAQKMEIVGRLAGGISHDFNNLLTVIIGFADLLLTRNGLREEAVEDLNQILYAAERARDLTHQLLAFSRKQRLEPEVLDVAGHLASSSKILRRVLGEDIALDVTTPADLWRIQADPSQLDQVLMNLVINARDAMNGGGRIQVSASNMSLPHAGENLRATPGDYVCIRITDEGGGIPPEILPHIFEPFFTTKESGKGTGLGLATVLGIVEQHGGWVDVQSTPGVGTTFIVALPRITGVEIKRRAASTETPAGSGQHILVVEDEPAALALADRMLTGHGYRVSYATTLAEALALLRQENCRVDLIFSDLVLPDGSGADLLDLARENVPPLHVIMTSGYADERSHVARVHALDVPFLQKPYNREQLLTRIHTLLTEPPAPQTGQGGGDR